MTSDYLESYVRNRLLQYMLAKRKSEFESCPPYKVDLVDMFHGESEEGYGNVGNYDSLETAIKVARGISEDSLKKANWEINEWRGMGDAGLVYDADKRLVWDGISEYGDAEKLKGLVENNETGFKIITEAMDFAINAHRGQFRKGTTIPYILHPMRVAELLLQYGCDAPQEVASALLHDTIEDTDVSTDDIRVEFGNGVADIVLALSAIDKKESWEERKLHTINYLKNAPLNVLWVECADKLDNIRAIHKDYDSLGDTLWGRFNRPKEKQKWYYESLASVLSSRKEGPDIARLIDDLSKEVKAVFG